MNQLYIHQKVPIANARIGIEINFNMPFLRNFVPVLINFLPIYRTYDTANLECQSRNK
jgi:hypothetical protein